MRNGLRYALPMAVVIALGLAPAILAGKGGNKPPSHGTAAPEITYVDQQGRVVICNEDGSNTVAIYQNRDAYLRRPRIVLRPELDGGEVFFVEWYPGSATRTILRTSFDVADGVVGGIRTETILDYPIESLTLAVAPGGESMAFLVGTASGSNALYQMETCGQPPCSFEHDAELLYEPAEDRWIGPIGGYTANGLAYYFVERSNVAGDFAFEIRQIDLFPGSSYGTVETVLGMSGIGMDLEPGRSEAAGLESRLVFDADKTVYIYDTETPEQAPVAIVEGHTATWSPDESRLLFLEYWGTERSCCSGPVAIVDLTTTPPTESRFAKFGTQADWARTPN